MTREIVKKPAADRGDLYLRWAERHGVEVADRLAGAEDVADAVKEFIVPPNTVDTYDKGWLVWERFCAEKGLPVTEGTRGTLVSFVTWAFHSGRKTPGPGGVLGYAPASVSAHLTAAIVGLRQRGHAVSRDAAAEAREALEGLTVKMLQAKERRGRGQAPAADTDGFYAIAEACDDTLTGMRDLALVLVSFNVAGRASEPAGLLDRDIRPNPRGMYVDILTGKTKLSVRDAAVPYADDSAICPVRAYRRWRNALHAVDPAYNNPSDPAFHAIDRWGRVGGAMSPDAVTRAIARIAERSGIELRWTGHSMRSGLATEARANGADALSIARQGGWAPNSRAMYGYMRRVDDWEDNAAGRITRKPRRK